MRKFTADVVIGLEIHAELNCQSKLFCSCSTKGSELPNTRTCPICLGHPGTRPVLNEKALSHAIKLCLALNCKISPELIFSRKSYFYPDMSKNFQTTQFEEPLGSNGSLKLSTGKIINITRVHMEEDPASLVYPGLISDSEYVLIDYNRAGNPLVEIVTEPEIASPAEARDFMKNLISILTYLRIFDPESIIKADANVSVKESGYTRIEIKNISGFKEIERALTYEITRQRTLLKRGIKIVQETRGWNEGAKTTRLLRTKETEADYGYIIEPDLPIAGITEEKVALIKKGLPELGHQKAERFVRDYKLDESDADIISADRDLAELFERTAKISDPVLAGRWIRRELLRVLNYNKKEVKDIKFDEKHLAEIVTLIKENKITESTGQRIMEKLMEEVFSPSEYVKKNNLVLIGAESELKNIIKKVISENEKAVLDYKAGVEKSFMFLVGQVMRETKGKAEPALVNKILKEEMG